MQIKGIVHKDHTLRPIASVKFVAGGIGHSFVTINVSTLLGETIDSVFVFYTREIDNLNLKPINVDKYFETEIDFE